MVAYISGSGIMEGIAFNAKLIFFAIGYMIERPSQLVAGNAVMSSHLILKPSGNHQRSADLPLQDWYQVLIANNLSSIQPIHKPCIAHQDLPSP